MLTSPAVTESSSAAPPARVVIHVDMDAFFASVEQRERPELRGQPVIVGGGSRRGVVCAASYEARPYGVGSAMPMAEARRRCPQAIVVAPRMARYAEVSERVFGIFHRYTPLVEGLSLDEAFLDVSGSAGLFGSGPEIAGDIKRAIRAELGLTASAGVAPCKYVAKVASDLRKPDGLVVVHAGQAAEFLAPLPVERMWGVGKVATARLREAGFETIGQLASASSQSLQTLLGRWGGTVQQLAAGQDGRPVVPDREAKSIGSESTFEWDLRDRQELERQLLWHATFVARRLSRTAVRCTVVRVKVRYGDFQLQSRQKRLGSAVFDVDSLFAAARALLGGFALQGRGVRLLGLSATGLVEEEPRQTSLFEDPVQTRRAAVQRLVSQVEERFGRASITRAALLPGPEAGTQLPDPTGRGARRGGDGRGGEQD